MTTVQLGYDKREVRTNGIWRKGIALSRGVGKSSYNKGNGETATIVWHYMVHGWATRGTIWIL